MIRFIIARPVMVSMILIGLCLLGIVSYHQLPVELIPYAELPMLIVQAYSVRDADPELVEKEAVLPLEGAIAELTDIDRIESYVDRRRAIIFVYYNQSTNLKYAYLKLHQQVESVKPELGDDYYVMVVKIDTEQLANQFMSLQVRGGGGLDRIRHLVDRDIVPPLESIDGIANVEVYGGRQRSIEVLLDEAALQAHHLTAASVTSQLAAGSSRKRFLGHAYDNRYKYFVNLTADYTEITDLEDIIIKEEGPVLLKHVASVIDGGAEEETISRVNGKEAITISLIRETEANLLSLSGSTRRIIDKLNQKVAAQDLELVIQSDAAEVIEENIDLIKQLALIGGILAVVILWLFLRNLSLVLLVAAAIPVSILIALNAFYAFGITINTLTLVGMAIALGMLLDNSIVVLENIYRLMARGKSALDAVVTGVGEVWRPVVAATLTTICVFLPFLYSENFLVRILGRHIGVSIISTLLVSLLVAFLLIPVCAGKLLSRRSAANTTTFNVVSQNNRLLQLYTLLLKSCLRFPARTIIWGVVLFFVSVLICLAVSVSVSEEVELDEFTLYVTLPSGATLESADQQVAKMEERVSDIAEVEDRLANISEDQATLTFKLKEDYQDIDRRDLNGIKEDILEKLADGFPRVDFSYEQPATNVRYRSGRGGPSGRAFMRLLGIGSPEEKVVIKGQNLPLMRVIADDIKYNIDNLQTVDRSHLNIAEGQPELRLLFDRALLSHFDIPLQSVAAELSGFRSEYRSGVTIKQGDEEIDVVIKNESLEEKSSDDLKELRIPTRSGGTVPLLQLAQLLYAKGYFNINRVNQEQQVEITYRFGKDISDTKDLLEMARREIDQIVAGIEIPAGIAVAVVHEETEFSEFYFLIGAAIILIYMILASVFESLATPLAMMFTIPLATIGAFWGLIVTGHSLLNANSLIGFLILLGVVVNNGIIMIDYSRLLRRQGMRPERALLTAGQARVRPILIMAITTVVAMLPLAMGKAEYVGKIGAPFAVTVIGGLTVGTLFTLVFIPTAYSGLENAINWWRRLNGKTKAAQVLAFAGGCWLIYQHVDSLLWRFANLAALVTIIPALTYFTLTSLRRARTRIIAADEPIRITVRNIVKNYDDHSRFVREWRKAERQRPRLLREGKLQTTPRLISLLWQLPLYLFVIYFVYIYLQSGFWLWFLSHAAFIYTIYLAQPLLLGSRQTAVRPTARRLIYKLLYWGIPTANLVLFLVRWDDLALVIMTGCFWYPALLIYATSRKLHHQQIEISRVSGRFALLRRMFYRLVQRVPVIGRRKKPFRALNRVSLEITSGMFGLVGPNGAGKTTLMRIICGILEPTRGVITVNGLDSQKHREELQGLIGYLPQEFGTYQNMTAYQFLDHHALLLGIWDSQRRQAAVKNAIASVHLDKERNNKIKTFSGGMKQRVGIAQTLLHLPRILVVDEPTAGLDPRERIRFRNLLAQLARDRIVIFSTHIIEDVSSSCNRVAVLNEGEVRFLGTPQEMVARATGCVWQANVSEETFEEIRHTLKVVHHLYEGNTIRVRIIASCQPLPQAREVLPTLEDAYLWLLDEQEDK